MTNILIIGGDSSVGKFLRKSLCKKYKVFTTSRRQKSSEDFIFDVLNLDVIELLHLPKQMVVIWCVDTIGAQDKFGKENLDLSREAESIRIFLECYDEYVSRFIFLSSDAVFGGETSSLKITSPRSGKSPYAKNKIQIENLLISQFPKATIIRLGKIIETSKFLQHAVIRIRSNEQVEAFENFLFSPIDFKAVSNVIETLTRSFSPAIVRLANTREVSYFEACIKITEILEKDKKLVTPIKMDLSHKNYRTSSLLSDLFEEVVIKQPLDYVKNIVN
jgi:dTDP-4-dehydrorhamnose reductase